MRGERGVRGPRQLEGILVRRTVLALASLLTLATAVAATTETASSQPSLRDVLNPVTKFGLVKTQSTAEVTVYSYSEEDGEDPYGFMELNLGVYAAADKEPFEIRAVRRSYSKPIEATRVSPSGNTVLPTDLVTGFDGLSDFATVKLIDSRGRTAFTRTVTFCPNGEAQRIKKDAPIDSYYPHECAGNIYSLGAVWGIQRGYAVPLLGEDAYLDLPAKQLPKPGRYRAEVKVSPAWTKALAIPARSATVTLQVKVVKGDNGEEEMLSKAKGSNERILAAPTKPRTRALATEKIPAGAPKPDLRALPAWSIASDGDNVVFAATVWNAGSSPLLVDGFRRKGADIMDAYQYVVDSNGKQVGYQNVGTMQWDPREEHHHWHFKDFARYSLVDKNKKQLFVSKKEAFCLANTDAVDYTVAGADWHPYNTDLSTACGEHTSLAVREVLASGSGDTYEQFRPGQSLSLKGRPNGTYYVKVEANPSRKLQETNVSNNISYRKITVGGRPGHRTVKAEKIGIIDEPTFDDEFLDTFRH